MGHTARSHRRRHPHPVAANSALLAPAPPKTKADCTPPRSRCPRTPLASLGALPPPASRPRLHAPFSLDADHLSFFICTPRRHVVPSPASPPLFKDAEHVEEEEISTTTALLAENDGADVSAVVQTPLSVLMALRRRARAKCIARRRRYCGSSVGLRANRRRDVSAGRSLSCRTTSALEVRHPSTMSATLRRDFVSHAPSFGVSTWL